MSLSLADLPMLTLFCAGLFFMRRIPERLYQTLKQSVGFWQWGRWQQACHGLRVLAHLSIACWFVHSLTGLLPCLYGYGRAVCTLVSAPVGAFFILIGVQVVLMEAVYWGYVGLLRYAASRQRRMGAEPEQGVQR